MHTVPVSRAPGIALAPWVERLWLSRSPETLHLLGLRGTRRPPSTEDDPSTTG